MKILSMSIKIDELIDKMSGKRVKKKGWMNLHSDFWHQCALALANYSSLTNGYFLLSPDSNSIL